MPDKKEPKKKSPTPWLGLPRREANQWTFSENKLLDQITTEIVTAWAYDLEAIRSTHEECKHLIGSVRILMESQHLYRKEMTQTTNELLRELEYFKVHVNREVEDIRHNLKTLRFMEEIKLMKDMISDLYVQSRKTPESQWTKFKKWIGISS